MLLLTAPDTVGDFICMAVTSKAYHPQSIAIGDGDFVIGRLPVASFVRADKVYTLCAAQIDHEVGTLQRETFRRAIAALCEVVDGRH